MENASELEVFLKLLGDGLSAGVGWCIRHWLRGFPFLQQGALVQGQDHPLLIVKQDLAHCFHSLSVARLVDHV